jgi:thiol:disulfide interchange protein DsbD
MRYVALGALFASAALGPIGSESREARESPVFTWSPETALEDASRAHRPSLVFFGADWSREDVRLERETFADPRVRRALRGFVSVKVDMTDSESEDVTRALRTYKVRGDPAILLFDPEGREVVRISSWVPPETLLPLLEGVRGGGPTRDGLF